MTPEVHKALLAIAIQAAFADGAKDEHEREEVRRIAENLADGNGTQDLPRLYQDVLLKRLPLATVAATLTDAGQRQFAYEMAVCVCEADGRLAEGERRFLDELKRLFNLPAVEADLIEGEVDLLVDQTEFVPPPQTKSAPVSSSVSAAEQDKSILNYALLTGALELLPQSWASMAIIPLQIRMVYGVGKAHGVALDQGHVKEFIAAAGVGLTQVARRYYAGGRTMSTALLRETFQDLLGPARQLQAQYLPQIQQRAATLDAGQVMALMRN